MIGTCTVPSCYPPIIDSSTNQTIHSRPFHHFMYPFMARHVTHMKQATTVAVAIDTLENAASPASDQPRGTPSFPSYSQMMF